MQFEPDLNKYRYLTAEGVTPDDLFEMQLQKMVDVDPDRYDYMPCVCNTYDDVLNFYAKTYPALDDRLVQCMARVAIGKPINRAERRRMARDSKKSPLLLKNS